MKKEEAAFREHIYNLVCGNLNLEIGFVPESDVVKNEFAEGSPCALSYGRMLDAYSRLCTRLGVQEWEDADVEVIINELLEIGRQIGMKMFDYGMYYGCEE